MSKKGNYYAIERASEKLEGISELLVTIATANPHEKIRFSAKTIMLLADTIDNVRYRLSSFMDDTAQYVSDLELEQPEYGQPIQEEKTPEFHDKDLLLL